MQLALPILKNYVSHLQYSTNVATPADIIMKDLVAPAKPITMGVTSPLSINEVNLNDLNAWSTLSTRNVPLVGFERKNSS